jgi:NAD(P)H-hydrate epimerase
VKDYHCTCVLKSATTIVASMDTHFQTYINLTGNSGMAKGGSGDVLAGMIGGMLAQMKEIPLAAQLCVWLHGKAGDLAAGERTEYSVLASDLLDYIPRAIAYTIDAYMH